MVGMLDEVPGPPLDEDHPCQNYDTVVEIIDEAADTGALPHLPDSREEVPKSQAVASRIQTIRTRLHLLGYLKHDNNTGVIDDQLRSAIKAFQGEANLLQDNWVGTKTWAALDQLVGFESAIDLTSWVGDLEKRSALRRAANLRLFVLGFLEKRPASMNSAGPAVRAAWRSFSTVAQLLCLSTETLDPDLSLHSLSVLFDQDAFIEPLANVAHATYGRLSGTVTAREAKRLIKTFMICCARIELWLHGADIAIDGVKKTEKVSVRVPKHIKKKDEKRFTLFRTLREFWIDSGEEESKAYALAGDVGPPFFSLLRMIASEEQEDDSGDTALEVYDTVLEATDEERGYIEARVRNLGSRLWDGVKRAWRWLKRSIRKIKNKIKEWAGNLARFIHKYATRTFQIMKTVVKAVKESIQILLPGDFSGSDPDHIVIRRDFDFDYKIFINARGAGELIEALIQKFTRAARSFKIGTQILGALVDVIVNVLKAGTVPWGWFTLILSLARTYKEIRALRYDGDFALLMATT